MMALLLASFATIKPIIKHWESSYGNQRDQDERNYPQNALIKKVATLSRTQGKKFGINAIQPPLKGKACALGSQGKSLNLSYEIH
jgi:hypothetical protein